MPRKNPEADLIFEAGGLSGFGVLAEQSDLNPTTVTRELIQNSLDAAREAGAKPAFVRFEIASCKRQDIPAFKTYKAAFRRAVKGFEKRHDGKLPDSAQSVVDAIETQTKRAEIETLFVMDNGVGLNESRMAALLAEGISDKSQAGAGSYGYGHTATIPASDLRYILYGGLCDGKKIAAGHAVLASFSEGGELKGKDGYFITEKTGKIETPFKYPTDKAIPDIVKSKLDMIEKEWGASGSVVVIPGFNHFHEEDDLWPMIEKAAAFNFFVAIAEGDLRIEYRKGETQHILDEDSIGNVLEKYKDEKQKRANYFSSGLKVQKAYATMVDGENHRVKTELGEIEIKLRNLSLGEQSQIDLCRNGMHITGDIRQLKAADFGSHAPFHCLVVVDTADGEFHRLVRKAEPPKHNAIEIKKLDAEEKRQIRKVFNEIKNYIHANIKKLEAKEFKIDDVLNITGHDINAVEKLQPRVRAGGKSGAGGGGGGKRKNGSGGGNDGGFRKSGRAVPFQASPVPTGRRSYEVRLLVPENRFNNEIRFALDEGLDLTCDDTTAEDYVALSNIKIDGAEVPEEKLVKDDDGKTLGINLGSDESEIRLTFDFSFLGDMDENTDMPVSLQAEMVSRKNEKDA